MKVTVLGGGSFSTPALFEALPEDFADWDFVLVGRSPERLRAVARASTLLAGDAGPRITARVADAETSAAALEDAQVVLIQVRIGGLEGRAFDESLRDWDRAACLPHGAPGPRSNAGSRRSARTRRPRWCS
jgi:alpha-galactosidase/6-phospho-beta-glucosidase family protein